ncbi:MAG: hypothetical protein H7Y18_03650 [Clostridiaceae bacterium]|nr:hypothetical protein [Clostridiaceae bacterium]
MIIDSQKSFTAEKINIFNKLMIDTIKVKEDEFEFHGKHYMVCSDGVCVQTLINDRILYRIFIEEGKNNSFVSNKLLKYL